MISLRFYKDCTAPCEAMNGGIMTPGEPVEGAAYVEDDPYVEEG